MAKQVEIYFKHIPNPPEFIEVTPLGQIENKQKGPFLEYIDKLKQKTDWEEGEDILPFIPNYVMNFFLDVPFKLSDLALYLPNTYYKPEDFAAPTLRVLSTACLVFGNGKLVVTGGKSGNNVKHAAYQYRRLLMKIHTLVRVLNNDGTPMLVGDDEVVTNPAFPKRPSPGVKRQVYAITSMEKLMKFKNYNLVNVVGSGLASIKPIDLALMRNIMTTSVSEWEPEIFPACKMKIPDKYVPLSVPKCTTHIFDSGACVIMGATCNEDVMNLFLFLKCVVKYFIDDQIGQTKITSKFHYRLGQIYAISELTKNMDSTHKQDLERKILEESSTKCFGSYYLEREKIERERISLGKFTLPKSDKHTNPPKQSSSLLSDTGLSSKIILGGDLHQSNQASTKRALKQIRSREMPKKRTRTKRDEDEGAQFDKQEEPLTKKVKQELETNFSLFFDSVQF